MKWLAHIIPIGLFLMLVSLAPAIVKDSLADQQAKSDLAEINHMIYGIFNVNSWKAKVAEIVYAEISKIDLKATAGKLKTTVENQLTAVIDRLNQQVQEANQGSLGGKLKQVMIDLVVDIEEVKKGVPGYADAILAEISKPETEKQVKDVATEQLRGYFAKTFKKQDMALVQEVLERTGTDSVEEANQKLNAEIQGRSEGLQTRSWALIALSVLLCLWLAIPANRTGVGLVAMFATLVVLLGIGVATPMIDLEAKIAEMSFVLVGHQVQFENQVLYFQSKSILDVFRLMITHPDLEMKAVGVLLVLFSIVFPITKMAGTLIYKFNLKNARKSSIVQVLAFKTGKWSMADVMVVAIIMAYIGFNGIVETQFGKIKDLVPSDMVFITTNGTALQMGFFIFFTYAVLAIIVAGYLKVDSVAASC